MIARIKSFFEGNLECKKDSPSENIHLAAAALLIEMTLADDKVLPSETEVMLDILRNRFDISSSNIDELVILANDEVKNATSLYQFTSLVNENYLDADKFQLVRAMWDVAYADGNIDKYEEALIRKVADLIYLPQTQFIKAKHTARDATKKT